MFTFLQKRVKSFGFAIKGITTLIRTQPNAVLHLLAAAIVIGMASFFDVERWEWIILIACITLVLAAEAFNTAIEFLTDLASPNLHPLAAKAKDTAAAAVLLCAIGALVIGLLVFLPYFKTI